MSKETPLQKYYRKINAEEREEKKEQYFDRLERFSSDCLKSLRLVCKQLDDPEMTEIHYQSLANQFKEIEQFKNTFNIRNE